MSIAMLCWVNYYFSNPSVFAMNYCSRTFLVWLFIRFAGISYGQFIAICYKSKLSMCVQEPLMIGRTGCVQGEI